MKVAMSKVFDQIIRLIKKNPVLFLIMLLALALRIIGVYPGYPTYHPDEGTSYGRAVTMLFNHLKPDFFDYPPGMAFINLVIFLNVFIPLSFLKLILINLDKFTELLKHIDEPYYFAITLKEYIFGPRLIYAYYWSRYISAIFGISTVYLVYVAGRRLFNKKTGLFAAFFLAVNYRHVLGSTLGLPDVYQALFGLLALIVSIVILNNNSLKSYLLGGIVAGIYSTLKYQVIAFLPVVTAHILYAFNKRNVSYLFNRYIIFAGLAMIITFFFINPYYLIDFKKAFPESTMDVRRYQMGILAFRPYHYFYLFHFALNELPTLAIIAGVIMGLFRRFQQSLLLLSFALPFLFMMMIWSNGGIYSRNFVTVIPFLLIFAGYFFSLILNQLGSRVGQWSVGIIVVLLLLVNYKGIINSSLMAYSFSRPWNSSVLEKWLLNTLPPNTTVRTYPLSGMEQEVLRDLKSNGRTIVSWDYDKGTHTLSDFQDEGVDFAILNTHTLQNPTYGWKSQLLPQVLFSYNTVPFDYIENGFFGLSIREFRQYTVYESYKSWQAFEEAGYLVFKIPPKPHELGERVMRIGFDTKDQKLEIKGMYLTVPPQVDWDAGSLSLRGGQLATSRVVFPPVKITPGKLYTVKGFIKNARRGSDLQLEGYLRIDFYKDAKQETVEKTSLAVAISNTVPIDETWYEVTAGMVAPVNSTYMTVSFQRRETLGKSYVDDIEVFQTDKLPNEPFKQIPYIKSTIPVESLYWDSFT